MTNAVFDALKAAFGESISRAKPEEVSDYNVRAPFAPLAIAHPRSTADVVAIVRHCVDAGLPMVPQGGRTGLAGGAVPLVPGSVVISLTRMAGLREIDAVGRTATVDVGCTVEQLDAAAGEHGLTFPFRIGSGGSAQIGGIVSTNAGGIRAWRHGGARQLVIGIEAVLPDGTVWSSLRGVRKASMGPDLGQLLIGAEGTLGIVTGATVELQRQEETGPTAFVAVRTVGDAVALFSALEAGGKLDACELISQAGMSRLAAMPGAPPLPLGTDHPWYVLVEWAGTTADGADLLEPAGALIVDGVIAASEQQRNDLWRIREMHGAACRRAGHPRQHDVAVPRSAIAAFMAEATNVALQRAPEWQPVPITHVGDGNVHFDLVPREAGTSPEFDGDLSAALHDLAHRFGGVFSAEHGIGASRAGELHRLMPAGNARALAALRQALDPQGLMNPGKVYPTSA